MSLLEVATNILVGLVVSFISQVVIFSAYDVHLSLTQNLTITLYFTAISVVRGFAIRRFFNYKNNKNDTYPEILTSLVGSTHCSRSRQRG